MVVLEKVENYLQEIEKNDKKGKKINAFIELKKEKELIEEAKKIDSKLKKRNAGKLAGYIVGVKSNICVKGLNASCASQTLKDFIAPYDAEVIKKIKNQDALILGMTNMDEFASGSSGETSAFGPTNNPSFLGKIPGGSSSGSAAAVAAGFCDVALGSDTGGSIRNPASHCGIVGFKPTYSSVSRYGLIDLSMSLDQIGVLSRKVDDATLFFEVMHGKDKKDSISQSMKFSNEKSKKVPEKIVIGLLSLDNLKVDKRIKELINNKTKEISKKYKWKVKKIEIKNIETAIATYYPLVYVEFFSATRRFDGRIYGKKIEDSAGPEVLRRIFGGREITKAEYKGRYYHRALLAKKFFEEQLSKIFKEIDCIVSPTVPKLPHQIGEKISIESMYDYDALTIPYSLYGNCAISLPAGKIDEVPTGIQIACDKFQEEKLFQIARAFENN